MRRPASRGKRRIEQAIKFLELSGESFASAEPREPFGWMRRVPCCPVIVVAKSVGAGA
jgi:hypothetical protein